MPTNLRLQQRDLLDMLTYGTPYFLRLKNSKIFLTGGTGFIGTWLLEAILFANTELALQVQITVLSRRPEEFIARLPHLGKHPAVCFVQGDIRSFGFPKQAFTHIIHAATDVVTYNTPLATFDTIVAGTRRVLDLCVAQGTPDLLLLSSGAVYGPIPYHITHVSEDYNGRSSTQQPLAAYGMGKIASEWLLSAYADQYQLAGKIARVFSLVGPYLPLDKHFAIGNFILNTLNRVPLQIQGDGTPHRSYLYGTDMVVWLLAILVEGKVGTPYNVGSDDSISIAELAKRVVQIAGLPSLAIELKSQPNAQQPYERYVPDITRACTALGVKITVPLDEAIKRTIEWHGALNP